MSVEVTPISTKSDFLVGPVFRTMFEEGMPRTVPERLWTSLIESVETRSPWGETELKLLEVKGLGQPTSLG